ncbi:hypothetical protein FOZ61_006608 [Perkinsus olseni]|uniref:Uncharacterized protein n=1 Tax=Perkinsus olseni TaxID=32597 RepID=A0A7J6LCR8_PEROL|nr:hypothetical protein FOZ61_006608 [Perkinsus olseni]
MAALARAAVASSSLSESGVSLNEPSTTVKGKWAAAVEPGGVRLLARRIAEVSATRLETSSVSSTPALRTTRLPQTTSAHSTSCMIERSAISQRYGSGSSMSAGGLSLAVEGVEAPSTFLRTAATPPGLSQGATPSIWPVAESATRRPEAAAALGTYFESRLFLRRLIVIYMHAWLNTTRRRRQQRRLCRYVLSRAATRVKSSALTFWRTLLCRRTAAHSIAESRSVVSKLVALAHSFHAWRRLTDTGRSLAEAKLRSHQYRDRIMLKAALWAWRVLAVRLSRPYSKARSSQTMTPPKQHNALLVWRNRVLEQRLSETRQQALGETDGIASSVAQRLDTLEAGLRAVQQYSPGPLEPGPAPLLVNGQWYTVHPVETAELAPEEAGVYVEEAVHALADGSLDTMANPVPQDEPMPATQPQYSMGELLGPEALSPFDEFPRAAYTDENQDGNPSVGLFGMSDAAVDPEVKGPVSASLESMQLPRVVLDNFDRTLQGSPSPLPCKRPKIPPPDITLASREGPPLAPQVHEPLDDASADESTLIKIDEDDSDIVTPKSPDPRVAGAADDTYALSIDTNIGTRQGPSESVDLVKRIEENARQAAASRQGAAMFASGVLPIFNPARPHKNLSERVGLSTAS